MTLVKDQTTKLKIATFGNLDHETVWISVFICGFIWVQVFLEVTAKTRVIFRNGGEFWQSSLVKLPKCLDRA